MDGWGEILRRENLLWLALFCISEIWLEFGVAECGPGERCLKYKEEIVTNKVSLSFKFGTLLAAVISHDLLIITQ